MSGIKKYANDCIIYQARIYGIPEEHIYFDDSADIWGYSWNAPKPFISDMDYYISQEKYQPLFYYTTAESIGDVLMYSVRSAVNEWKKNGDTDEEVSKWGNFTIKWKDLGHNNYEIYVMWGGKGIRN